jgi:hypothetical protein
MDVSFRDESRFVWAQFDGTWNLDEFSEPVESIRKECGARKCGLLLVDLHVLKNQELTTFERYKMGLAAASLVSGVRRLAALARADQIDPERFGETVARNRGMNVRVFADLGTAQSWLLAG